MGNLLNIPEIRLRNAINTTPTDHLNTESERNNTQLIFLAFRVVTSSPVRERSLCVPDGTSEHGERTEQHVDDLLLFRHLE